MNRCVPAINYNTKAETTQFAIKMDLLNKRLIDSTVGKHRAGRRIARGGLRTDSRHYYPYLNLSICQPGLQNGKLSDVTHVKKHKNMLFQQSQPKKTRWINER